MTYRFCEEHGKKPPERMSGSDEIFFKFVFFIIGVYFNVGIVVGFVTLLVWTFIGPVNPKRSDWTYLLGGVFLGGLYEMVSEPLTIKTGGDLFPPLLLLSILIVSPWIFFFILGS